MSLLTVIAIGFVLLIVAGTVLGFALFYVAARADRQAKDALRREPERREALKRISGPGCRDSNRISGGPGCGWRSR